MAQLNNQKNVGADTSPIVTEVDHQGDQLKNHEARISNLESNQQVLQDSTKTAPSSNQQSVPVVRSVTPGQTTTSSNSVATAAPVADTPATPTVVSFREIVLDADTSDCEYTYSDGTTYQFHWKTTNPQGSWVTDGNGNNGHWVKTTQTSGFCDSRALGRTKAS